MRGVLFFIDQRSIALYRSMKGISASASDEELRDVLGSEGVASSPVIWDLRPVTRVVTAIGCARVPFVPIGQMNLNAKSLPKESGDRIRVLIWTSVFRSFKSGDQQIILFRETDSQFRAAEIAIAFGVSVCLISNVVTKRIISAHDDFDPENSQMPNHDPANS
jgi:hypothetical protein